MVQSLVLHVYTTHTHTHIHTERGRETEIHIETDRQRERERKKMNLPKAIQKTFSGDSTNSSSSESVTNGVNNNGQVHLGSCFWGIL